MRTQRIGQQAEDAALKYLRAAGLRLIKRNFSCKTGEIDLVMRDKSKLQAQILVFVEVRYRAAQNYGGALASVTHTKRTRLTRSAQRFQQLHRQYAQWPCRFDVVALSGTLQAPDINWIAGAFSANSASHR